MEGQVLFLVRLLFWVMSAGVLFLPMRWALLCLVILGNCDINPADFASATSVGFENAVKAGVLPLILLLRLSFKPLIQVGWRLPHKAWVALVLYAALAASWSDFRLSALKMIVYLADYFLLFTLLSYAWKEGLINGRLIRLATWLVLLLAALQTYVLGNPLGGLEDRFTSFTSPQYFATYLVAVLAILVFSEEGGPLHYGLTCGAVLTAILLSGSRFIFVSTIFLFLIAQVHFAHKGPSAPTFMAVLHRIVLAGALIVLTVALLIPYSPSAHLREFFDVLSTKNSSIEDMVNVGWRLGMYSKIVDSLEHRNTMQLLVGTGTSSGAYLRMEYEPGRYSKDEIDGNRVVHDEFLRAIYEWGIVGLTLLVCFLASTVVGCFRKAAAHHRGALALLAVLPAIILALAVENMLAAAISAGGIGIVLILSYAFPTAGQAVGQT
jgi:hypothetical protein